MSKRYYVDIIVNGNYFAVNIFVNNYHEKKSWQAETWRTKCQRRSVLRAGNAAGSKGDLRGNTPFQYGQAGLAAKSIALSSRDG